MVRKTSTEEITIEQESSVMSISGDEWNLPSTIAHGLSCSSMYQKAVEEICSVSGARKEIRELDDQQTIKDTEIHYAGKEWATSRKSKL